MNPVAKNAHKFNKSAVHRDKKNDYKRNRIDLDEEDFEHNLEEATETILDCLDKMMTSEYFRFDISPCKNCGRKVYVGKCCDNPNNDIIDLGE